MSWEPRHEKLYKDGVLIRHRIQRTPDGEWEDYVEEKVELPKQSMRMKVFPYTGAGTDGMDLRDWFAGQVLCGIASITNVDWGGRDQVAKLCYDLADAMMEARKDD